MQKIRKPLTVWLFAAVVGSSPSHAEVNQAEREADSVRALEQAGTIASMDVATEALYASRRETMSRLAQLLKNTGNPEIKFRAGYLLGIYRSEVGCSELIQNIDLEAPQPLDYTRMPRWGLLPCKEALVRIGRPATRDLVDALGTTDRDDLRSHILDVLDQIGSKEEAERTLRDAEAAAEDPVVRQRLKLALELTAKSDSR